MDYISKRKNPDRYIVRLKNEIDRLYRVEQNLRRRQGRIEFRYGRDVTTSVHLSDPRENPDLLPGTEVIFTGTVTEVKRDKHDANIKFNLEWCKRIKETP